MALRIGEILVRRGALTPEACAAILDAQANRPRPFGLLAEELYNVSPAVVEQAWVEQYSQLTQRINPAHERFDRAAVDLVSCRQAWQFKALPVRRDGTELMLVTAEPFLARALRFAMSSLATPCYFVLADVGSFGTALETHRPLDGMSTSHLYEAA